MKIMKGPISALLWILTVFIYLRISFTTHRWAITWLVFMVAVVLQMVINLFFSPPKFYRGHLTAIIWTSCVLLYLAVSFLTFRWHITWVIFLIPVAFQFIIKGVSR